MYLHIQTLTLLLDFKWSHFKKTQNKYFKKLQFYLFK